MRWLVILYVSDRTPGTLTRRATAILSQLSFAGQSVFDQLIANCPR